MAEDQFTGISTRRDMAGTKARIQQVQGQIDSAESQAPNSVAIDGSAVTVSKSLTQAIQSPDAVKKSIEAAPQLAYQTAGQGSIVNGIMGEAALTTALSAGPTIVQPDELDGSAETAMPGAGKLEGSVKDMAERAESFGTFDAAGSVDLQIKNSEMAQLEGDIEILTAAERVGKDHQQASKMGDSGTPGTDSTVGEVVG